MPGAPSVEAMLLAHDLLGSGSLPSLVLIHGITESHLAWEPLVESLASAHQVLAVDLRGHGHSVDIYGYDPQTYARDVIETAEAVGVENPLVVGHSLGGVVATAYAALAACRGVINVDQPLQLAAFKDSLAPLEPLLQGSEEEFAQAMAMVFGALDGPLPGAEQARLARVRQPLQHVVLGTWETVFESSPEQLDAMAAELAAKVAVPYLSLHGDDPGPEYADWLYRQIPTATIEVWADSGHYPHLVHPARFVARLAEFEASLPS